MIEGSGTSLQGAYDEREDTNLKTDWTELCLYGTKFLRHGFYWLRVLRFKDNDVIQQTKAVYEVNSAKNGRRIRIRPIWPRVVGGLRGTLHFRPFMGGTFRHPLLAPCLVKDLRSGTSLQGASVDGGEMNLKNVWKELSLYGTQF